MRDRRRFRVRTELSSITNLRDATDRFALASVARLSFRAATALLSFRAAMPPLSFRAAGEESQPLATPRSLAFARDDEPASFHRGLASSFRAATPPLSFRTAKPPLSFRTATPPLSFRAAGEESPPLATPRSLAFARDDEPTSFHPSLASSFRAATPPLSFRAAGEESRRLAARRSLAIARDGDGESLQAQGDESAPLATPGSLALLGKIEPVSARATRTCGVRGVTRLRNGQ
jgi:hypothetical protein